jgi:hypothetical protein
MSESLKMPHYLAKMCNLMNLIKKKDQTRRRHSRNYLDKKNLGLLEIILILTSILIPFNIKFMSNYQANPDSLDNRVSKTAPLASSMDGQIWNKTWGGTGNDYDMSSETIWGDGTYLYTTGYTESFGAGGSDLVLIKWDINGTQIWYKTWGGTDDDFGYSIWGDGTYLYTTGSAFYYGPDTSDLIIIKWDTNGNQIWNKTWGGSFGDEGRGIWGDATYLYTTGWTTSFGSGLADFIIIKWDANGNQIWNKTWGGSGYDYGDSIWGDGTYLYTSGHTTSHGAGGRDLLLNKWDTSGNLIFYKTWGGSLNEIGYSIWGNDSYLYITGLTFSYGVGNGDILLIKFDSDGNQIWYKTWGGTAGDIGYAIWGDGTYLYTACSVFSFGAGGCDLALVKWDINGNQIWYKTWGGSSNDYGYSIWGDGTNVYTMGHTASYGNGNNDQMIIKWEPASITPTTSTTTSTPNTLNDYIKIITDNITIFVALIIMVIVGILITFRVKKNKGLKNNRIEKRIPSIGNNTYIDKRYQSAQIRAGEPKNRLNQQQNFETQRRFEQNLLIKFQEIMKMVNEIKKTEVAELLGISEKDLLHNLFKWKERFPFKINGDMLVVDNISEFIGALDNQFNEWKINEEEKDGKRE